MRPNILLTRLAPRERTRDLAMALTSVWRRSVDATHGFVLKKHLDEFEAIVPEALLAVPVLFVAEVFVEDNVGGGALVPAGFAGTDGESLEMLFVDAVYRGCGIGGHLLAAAMAEGVRTTTVNQENAQAVGFYEHAGFVTTARCEHDPMGLPYPILTMRLRDAQAPCLSQQGL